MEAVPFGLDRDIHFTARILPAEPPSNPWTLDLKSPDGANSFSMNIVRNRWTFHKLVPGAETCSRQ
jgi:hypothetical protein